MSETTFVRTKKITRLNGTAPMSSGEGESATTTNLLNGGYLLEWKDENDETLISMSLNIDGALSPDAVEEVINQNFRLMKDSHPELFVEPNTGNMEGLIDGNV